jgi:PAS domain S-box-containing protein
MDDVSLAPALDEIQQRHAVLLHEHEKLLHAIGDPNAQLKLAIFDRLPMPVWACDRTCRIVFWNDAAARLYGFPEHEAIGQDFVELFVNVPEREKARIDCIDIIDNNRNIRNMADDLDKHGNTRTLVTQCFPVYNVQGYPGLQVEVSYEVQDIERLQRELQALQEAYRRAELEREEMHRKFVETTRSRALKALESVVEAVRESNRARRNAIHQAELKKGADPNSLAKAKSEVRQELDRLIKWESEIRKRVMSETTIEELDALIDTIERSEPFDV